MRPRDGGYDVSGLSSAFEICCSREETMERACSSMRCRTENGRRAARRGRADSDHEVRASTYCSIEGWICLALGEVRRLLKHLLTTMRCANSRRPRPAIKTPPLQARHRRPTRNPAVPAHNRSTHAKATFQPTGTSIHSVCSFLTSCPSLHFRTHFQAPLSLPPLTKHLLSSK